MSSEIAEPQGSETRASSGSAAPQPATVIVRGETATDPSPKPAPKESSAPNQKTPAPKKISEAKAKLESRLPSLDDFEDIGVQKEQVVVRDGKPDLAFTGTLLASAAPSTAVKGHWEELRVYRTSAGKHVFSKIKRTLYVGEYDECQAEVFDPEPTSTTAQLLRSAHDLTHSKPKTWKDAAVDFFGYQPLAKELYRKLGDQFEERVS
ncbi:MAG TPA: hypothetical protein VN815_04495 [Steroidobacteraceae bacterium]|nr:hypothetical protein [Steroidobacteraceae bacterium]